MLDSEVLTSNAEALSPWDEPKPAQGSSRRSLWIAVGLVLGLAILLLILFWPLSHRGSAVLPSAAATTVSKSAEAPVPHLISAAVKSHASIRTNDRSWITACVDGKVVFSKLFTAGSQDSVDFVDRAVVRTGNAGPVEITLDGKPVGALGQTGQVRVIELVPGAPRFLVGGEADDCTLTKSR
jgi:hypothetical protein